MERTVLKMRQQALLHFKTTLLRPTENDDDMQTDNDEGGAAQWWL